MQVLIVAATQAEVAPLAASLGGHVDILVTGVGMTATALALGRHLATRRYDLAVNLGIAGGFDRSRDLGAVVEVSRDTFSELGAEDGSEFLPISGLGFGQEMWFPTTSLQELGHAARLPAATAVTVNTVHGDEASIARVVQRLAPDIESMEGAAFFQGCQSADVPCVQVRAVSNYVERRNRAGWQIGPAIENLNRFAISLVAELTCP